MGLFTKSAAKPVGLAKDPVAAKAAASPPAQQPQATAVAAASKPQKNLEPRAPAEPQPQQQQNQQHQNQQPAAQRNSEASSTSSTFEAPPSTAHKQPRSSYEKLRVQVPGSSSQVEEQLQPPQKQQQQLALQHPRSKLGGGTTGPPNSKRKALLRPPTSTKAHAAPAAAAAPPPQAVTEPALLEVDMIGAREALVHLTQQVQEQMMQQQLLQQERCQLLGEQQQAQPPEAAQQPPLPAPNYGKTAASFIYPAAAATSVPTTATSRLPAATTGPLLDASLFVDRRAAPVAAPTGQQPDATWSAQQLLAECERQRYQIAVEQRAREELEDMLLRLERHFKEETASREAAEGRASAAAGGEAEAQGALAAANRLRAEELTALQIEKETVAKERQALEEMRRQFDLEVQQARNEASAAWSC